MNAKLKCKHKACGAYVYREEGVFDNRSSKRFFCSIDCMIKQGALEGVRKAEKAAKQAERQYNKEIKVKEKQDRVEHKIKKDSLKSTGVLMAEAQTAVNSYVKLRDYGKPCPTCNKPHLIEDNERGWDAGHVIAVGKSTNLRYNLFNINRQCVDCNHHGGGMPVEYEEWTRERYGDALMDSMKAIAKRKTPVKWTKMHLIRLKKVFQKRKLHLIRLRKRIANK